MNPEDRTLLDITRTGSSWTRVAAYGAGQVEDKTCQNCFEAEEDANRFWACKALNTAREKAGKELAELDPNISPASVRQGIAPALSANCCGAFWGECKGQAPVAYATAKEKVSEKQWQLIGGNGERNAHPTIKKELATF